MRRNKIKTGWDAIPKQKKKFVKSKVSWTTQYEYKHQNEDSIFSRIIKFIISISLFFVFDRKSFTKTKKNLTINNTYNLLSSSKFKFIPSSVAFYLFLSAIPVLIIIKSIISAMSTEWSNFLENDILQNIIPGINELFNVRIDFKTTEILLVTFFILSSIWFASKGISKFQDSFTELYGIESKQNFIFKRLKAIFIFISISLYFAIMAISFVPLMMIIKNNVPNEISYLVLLYFFMVIYVVFFGYIGIGLLFRFISPIRLKWSYLNLGILTSLIPIIIFLVVFATICKFLNYEKFGLIGSFLYLLLFILYVSYFLHAGIIMNSSYYKTNVFKNVVVKKSLVPKKIIVKFKNFWHWITSFKSG